MPSGKRRGGMQVFTRILDVVRRVPRGRVATYGQIARLAGLPRHARHVGYALHGLPFGTPLPWHRVLNASGGISQRGWDAMATQRLRLESEGVAFGPRGRVALDRYGWRPNAARARRLRSPDRSRPPRRNAARPGTRTR